MSIKSLALQLKFSNTPDLSKTLTEMGLEYRKGKTIQDVRKAMTDAHKPKNGMYRTDTELSALEYYLGTVLKVSKVQKEG
jgi:hypothetical protein